MYKFNRDLAVEEIDWTPKRLYYLEAWIYPNVKYAKPWNFRHGFLEDSQVEDLLHRKHEFSPPATPPGIRRPRGGLRLLACDFTFFEREALGMSRRAFDLVESAFDLHPATLQSLQIPTGTFSKHSHHGNRISIILKAPQKFETGNSLLSLTHDPSTNWTTALLAGEAISATLLAVEDPLLPPAPTSQCAVIRHYLASTVGAWSHPLTIPSIIVTHHLRRLQDLVTRDLTPHVINIEEDLGVTQLGRVEYEPFSRDVYNNLGSHGKPIQRAQAEGLTVQINTELTRVHFTSHNPTWNHEASMFLIKMLTELIKADPKLSKWNEEFMSLLEYNLTIAKSLDRHVLALQRRLELQLNVLYSFVAQTDNRLSARLAATAGRDSTSMKILAFITTMFLPGTFVATLFSMEMFNWVDPSSDPDTDRPTASPYFWIYWAVAAPLTVVTLSGWALWWNFEKHRYDKHLDNSGQRVVKPDSNSWRDWLWRSKDPLLPTTVDSTGETNPANGALHVVPAAVATAGKTSIPSLPLTVLPATVASANAVAIPNVPWDELAMYNDRPKPRGGRGGYN